ncbi:hypothetical protein [Aquimarina algiphila]|uniref:hypothetical protein n=1 Tax=Aquimarina algiphila TaxID=2047982 RepID=UPI0023314816|nr:hypothetical protein [Aquimarina algiphila]
MKKIILLLVTLITSSVLQSQSLTVNKLDISTNFKANDLIYALPVTTLNCKAEVKESIFKTPKKDVEEDKIFVSSPSITIPNETNSDIIKLKINNISLFTKAIPDEKHIYKISLKKRWNKENKVGLKIGKNGLIQGGELTSEDKTFKIITTAISSVAGLFKVNSTGNPYDPEKDGKRLFKELKVSDIKSYSDNGSEEYKIAEKLRVLLKKRNSIDNKINGNNNLNIKGYTKQLIELQDNFARKNKFGKDLNVYKHRIFTLKELISKLKSDREKLQLEFIKVISSFLGTKKSRTIEVEGLVSNQFNHGTFSDIDNYYKIKFDSASEEIVMETSSKDVFDKTDDGSRCENCFRIKIQKDTDDFGDNFYSKIGSSNNAGLAYKVPASYEAKVFTNDFGELGSYNFYAVGNIYGRLSSKTNINNLVYYSDLGWFKEINATTKSINPDDISSIGSSVKEVKDLVKGKSETESLKEETELLELRLKKRDLEKQLEGNNEEDEE